MSVSSPIPTGGGPSWPQATALELLTDSLAEALEHRVADLEHAVCSRPARRRLRRRIRRSVAVFAWAGPDFQTRRAEAAGTQWLTCTQDQS